MPISSPASTINPVLSHAPASNTSCTHSPTPPSPPSIPLSSPAPAAISPSPAPAAISPSSAPVSPSPTYPTHSTSDSTTDSPSSPDPPPAPTHHMVTRSKAGIIKPRTFTVLLITSLPKSITQALVIPVWRQAMMEEFLALLRNHTWTLTILPPGKNVVGYTCIFRLKKHADGSIARYKARLVAQGFSQEPGFDFTETFSPVVKPNTIRLILSIAVSSSWQITHLDVNNASLHGSLDEEIYMKQPLGFE